MDIIKKIIDNPRVILIKFVKLLSPIIPNDKTYLGLRYWSVFGKSIDWLNPISYNEKLQWLKVYDRNPIYTTLVDKYLVKEYISNKYGGGYIIPTLGVWDDPDEIDFSSLPDKFVLKCNHNSGIGMCVCKDKSRLNIKKVKEELRKGLKENYYIHNREWPYKNVPRKIIAEKFMEDGKYGELRDYKFFCFNGEVKGLFVATGRSKGESSVCFDFFDENYNHLDLLHGHPNAPEIPEKPLCFEEMKMLASKLSAGIPAVRVDLYEINHKVYFGEMTFSHWGGFMPFTPHTWDKIFGEFIKLN